MSRVTFSSNNKEDEVFNFKTNAGSGNTFNPTVSVNFPKRIHWDFGDGSSYFAGTSGAHTFNDSGTTKNCKIIGDDFSKITNLFFAGDNIIDNFNVDSRFSNLANLTVSQNSGLTGLTIDYIETPIAISCFLCNLTGNLDLTKVKLKNTGRFDNNNLTSIIHTGSSENITTYWAYSNDLVGNLDVSPLSGLGGSFNVFSNTTLTGITHTYSPNTFNTYNSSNCNLIGNHDLSMFPNLGGAISLYNNINLTGITHTYSPNTFNTYHAFNCGLIGNHDLSMFPNLGGSLNLGSNPDLTGITHTASTQTFTQYSVVNCDLIGNHDISMLSNIGGSVTLQLNPNLTGITFTTASTQNIRDLNISSCDIQGTVDLTPFAGFGATSTVSQSQIKVNSNSGLTNIIFPPSNGFYYRNGSNNQLNAAFGLYSAALGYIDFKPLSGSTLISGTTVGIPRFELAANSMTTSEVNHILSDLDTISSLNYSGWTSTSGTTSGYINISSNSAPDGSSGGYNGTGATINLISKGWTVITD